MKNKRKIFFYFGIVVGWGIFSWQVVNGIHAIIQQKILIPSPFQLLLVFLGMLIYNGSQITNWYVMLNGIGRKIEWRNVARGYSFSSVSRYIPGTIWGYISRSEWMYREYNVPYNQSGAASIFEISFSFSSAFLMIGVAGLLDSKLGKGSWILGALCIPIIMWLLFENLGKIKDLNFFNKTFHNPIKKIPLITWFLSYLICIVQWIFYGLLILLLVVAIQEPKTFQIGIVTGSVSGIFSYAFAWVIGFIFPFIPGGIGIREFVLATFLGFFFGLDSSQGSAIAIIIRIMYSIAEFTWTIWGLNQPK